MADATRIGREAPYRLVAIERLTPTILELWLWPLDAPLEYLPGEYVLIEDRDGNPPPRSYSIANPPRSDQLLSMLVTRVPGGLTSNWIHDCLRVDDELILSGPYGSFVDDPASTVPGLFLAAGSGLAPIRSLIEAGLAAGTRRSLTLIFSARTEAEVIDRERLATWQARYPQFRFIRTLTRGAGPPPRGRIPALLLSHQQELDDHDVFIAGAPGFVLACTAAAEALGASPERVHTEVFFAEPHPAASSTRRHDGAQRDVRAVRRGPDLAFLGGPG
jgi:CDP-4-dehydro-6-deoxyglucose reductase